MELYRSYIHSGFVWIARPSKLRTCQEEKDKDDAIEIGYT